MPKTENWLVFTELKVYEAVEINNCFFKEKSH